ncbi:MAG: long-chain fatty acid--CoA ligase [Planctomycetes bacterium]|nr:long-chain fatty acid--CoA ligase [Planctomycetota bacterium]
MPNNLATLHRDACTRWGANTALRFKKWGRYQDLSWTAYRHQADGAAAGLLELGIAPGDRVAILSENRYEWLIADHAILSAAAVNVPLHAPLTPPQAAYQLEHSDARGIFVSHQMQADKIVQILDRLPRLEFLISFEPIVPPAGLKHWTWQGLLQRGWQAGAATRAEIRGREARLGLNDLATLIYTSGTTGNPKGVMLTQGNLLSNSLATLKLADIRPGDVQLSWLPYSHIYSRTVDHYLTTAAGSTLALAESVDTLVANLAETRPMWMTSVPRFYEKIWAAVEAVVPEKRASELRRIFGPRCRYLSSGGAPLPRHICQGFHELGISIFEGYGLTETSPVVCFNSPAKYRLGSVGPAIGDVEIRIADDGEILTRGPHVMLGYWKNPEATAETIVDGWLHTGDVGRLDDDGFLYITDRKKDLIITSGGKNIAPTELERLLVSDPYIDQALVYGDRRPFVAAIIVPNFAKLAAEQQARGWSLDTVDEFIQTPAIIDFFQSRIDALMEAVSQPERVKACLVLARPFQMADEELTATLKLRRRHVVAKFERQLELLYAAGPSPIAHP